MTMTVERFTEILVDHGMRHGSGVPCSYFTPLVSHMGVAPDLRYLPAASEGEAVAIAAGMVTGGRPAFALMQNSGLGNAVNPVTSLLYPYQIPVVLLVSHRGEPGRADEPQHERMGEITADLVRLCGIECRGLRPETFADELTDVRRRAVPAAWVCRKGTFTGPPSPAVSFTLESGRSSRDEPRRYAPQMRREEALRAMLPWLNEGDELPAVISTTGKLSRELYELDDREHTRRNRFYMVGSMGCAAGFGLGVAQTRSGRVLVLDGDGALLMKLGTLASVGGAAPSGFHHVVLDNGAHDSTGGQPTVSPNVDLAAVALACGYRRAATVDSAEALCRVLEEHLEQDGPTFLRVLIRTGARPDLGRPRLSPRQGWERFQDWLQESATP